MLEDRTPIEATVIRAQPLVVCGEVRVDGACSVPIIGRRIRASAYTSTPMFAPRERSSCCQVPGTLASLAVEKPGGWTARCARPGDCRRVRPRWRSDTRGFGSTTAHGPTGTTTWRCRSNAAPPRSPPSCATGDRSPTGEARAQCRHQSTTPPSPQTARLARRSYERRTALTTKVT